MCSSDLVVGCVQNTARVADDAVGPSARLRCGDGSGDGGVEVGGRGLRHREVAGARVGGDGAADRLRGWKVEHRHAGIADVEGQLIEACRAANVTLPPAVQAHLSGWYGTEAPAVFGYALASPFGLATVTSDSPVLLAELAFARDHAMAVTPDDAIYRRTSLGGTGRVPAEILRTVAKIWE